MLTLEEAERLFAEAHKHYHGHMLTLWDSPLREAVKKRFGHDYGHTIEMLVAEVFFVLACDRQKVGIDRGACLHSKMPKRSHDETVNDRCPDCGFMSSQATGRLT